MFLFRINFALQNCNQNIFFDIANMAGEAKAFFIIVVVIAIMAGFAVGGYFLFKEYRKEHPSHSPHSQSPSPPPHHNRIPTGPVCDVHGASPCPKGHDCAYPHIGADEKICCPGKSTLLNAKYYCDAVVPDGDKCWGDAMCQSGDCYRKTILETGTCVERRTPAQQCYHDADCESRACGYYSANESDKYEQCCPTNQLFGLPDTEFVYCAGTAKTGDQCWVNEMCASKMCKGGDPIHFTKGVCQ